MKETRDAEVINNAENEAAEIPYIFFLGGGALMTFVTWYNNFYLGVTLGWVGLFLPVTATWQATWCVGDVLHVAIRSKNLCVKITVSICIAYMLALSIWITTVYGQMTSQFAGIDANYKRGVYLAGPDDYTEVWLFFLWWAIALLSFYLICLLAGQITKATANPEDQGNDMMPALLDEPQSVAQTNINKTADSPEDAMML